MTVRAINRSSGESEQLTASLYLSSYQRVATHLKRYSQTDAEDLAQDALLIVLEKLREGKVADIDQLEGYYFQTATNVAIAHLRKKGRRRDITERYLADFEPEAQANGDDKISERESKDQIASALKQLSQTRDQEILTQHYILDCDKEVVRQNLELAPNQFDRVLHNARRRLSQLLAPQASADLQAIPG